MSKGTKSYLPHPESVTDVQVNTLLKILFHRSDIRQLMEKILKVNEEDAIRKLERIPEPECSQFVAATKAKFLAARGNSIRQRLAAAKAQEPIMLGHDLSGKEQFRFYLSDESYRNAKHSEQEGEIKIKSHAAVALRPAGASCGKQMISTPFQSSQEKCNVPCAGCRQLPL